MTIKTTHNLGDTIVYNSKEGKTQGKVVGINSKTDDKHTIIEYILLLANYKYVVVSEIIN